MNNARQERSTALDVADLSMRYDTQPVLHDFDLRVNRGELVALLGPSGCGKTTALRLIAGFERPGSGTITIGDDLVCTVNGTRERWLPPEGRRVGMVFQDYALFPHLSVARNVAFGLPRQMQDRDKRIRAVLKTVGLSGMGERTPDQLSGGQQQRVALARALAPGPDIVLLDEPFSNLDTDLRAAVRDDVRRILHEAGATAILVTHDQEEALSIADRVAVMLDGCVAQIGPPEEIYHRPSSREIADFVGDAQYIAGFADGRQATTSLGIVPLHGSFQGPVDLLLRPEMVRLTRLDMTPEPDHEQRGAPAMIVSRTFYGHDQLLHLELASGEPLAARLGTYSGFRPGDRVNVSVRGGALAFPHVTGS
jgi:iron(III) transport system ATP-binding protein